MQLTIDVPNEIGERLQKLSRPELLSALRLIVQNAPARGEVTKKRVRMSIKDTPAFGMWADREDMQDPARYVRELRKPRSF